MRILREHTIGLVIDMQERLVPVMEEQEQLIENCSRLIRGLQILGLPIFVTQQYTKGLGETIEEIKSVIQDFNPIELGDRRRAHGTSALLALRLGARPR